MSLVAASITPTHDKPLKSVIFSWVNDTLQKRAWSQASMSVTYLLQKDVFRVRGIQTARDWMRRSEHEGWKGSSWSGSLTSKLQSAGPCRMPEKLTLRAYARPLSGCIKQCWWARDTRTSEKKDVCFVHLPLLCPQRWGSRSERACLQSDFLVLQPD